MKDVLNAFQDKKESEWLSFWVALNMDTANTITLEDEMKELTMLGYMNLYERCLALFNKNLFDRPEGIHGYNHMRRVLLHSLSLARALELDDFDTRILAIASMYHDIGRTHDWEDTTHGDDGWKKTVKLGLLETEDIQLGLESIYRDDKHIIEFLIRHHCRSDETIKKKLQKVSVKERERTEKLMWCLKEADGLDRVRLGDLDIRYLRFPESKQRVQFALELLNEIPVFNE